MAEKQVPEDDKATMSRFEHRQDKEEKKEGAKAADEEPQTGEGKLKRKEYEEAYDGDEPMKSRRWIAEKC